MSAVRVAHPDPVAVAALAEAVDRHDGFPALGEPLRRDLDRPGPSSFDVTADVEGHLVALAHVMAAEDRPGAPREIGVLVDPSAREPGLVAELLGACLDALGPDEAVVVWFPGAPPPLVQGALDAGLLPQRRLLRMERPLDGPDELQPAWPPDVTVSTFRPGVDDADWLSANNRAFAGHPEQGSWTLATLRRHLAEPWFEPGGFLLARRGGALAGSCWTKQHEGGVGEIFVIGVDPAHQGGGLGRALVVGGLRSLRDRGATTGMLYVDAANEAAVELYRSLRFEVVRTDAALAREAP